MFKVSTSVFKLIRFVGRSIVFRGSQKAPSEGRDGRDSYPQSEGHSPSAQLLMLTAKQIDTGTPFLKSLV